MFFEKRVCEEGEQRGGEVEGNLSGGDRWMGMEEGSMYIRRRQRGWKKENKQISCSLIDNISTLLPTF